MEAKGASRGSIGEAGVVFVDLRSSGFWRFCCLHVVGSWAAEDRPFAGSG